jgi:hypothetical protein
MSINLTISIYYLFIISATLFTIRLIHGVLMLMVVTILTLLLLVSTTLFTIYYMYYIYCSLHCATILPHLPLPLPTDATDPPHAQKSYR